MLQGCHDLWVNCSRKSRSAGTADLQEVKTELKDEAALTGCSGIPGAIKQAIPCDGLYYPPKE